MADESADRTDHHVPTLDHAFDLDVDIGKPIEIGETGSGHRRIVPITGGTVSGAIDGEILPAGADFQLLRLDEPTDLVAKYAFETTSGSRVYVENRGIAVAPREINERVKEGRPVDTDEIYFRTVPSFETADEELAWLSETLFIGAASVQEATVRISVYAVE